MVRGFSKAILMGNLTRDPETRAIPSGSTVTSFGIAVNRSYRSQSGQDVEEVSFFDCEAWGRQGETIAQYLHRGDGILVSGRLRQDRFKDKDGNDRTVVRLTVEDSTFLPRSSGGGDGGGFSAAGSYGGGGGGQSSGSSSGDVIPTDIPDGAVDLQDIPF